MVVRYLDVLPNDFAFLTNAGDKNLRSMHPSECEKSLSFLRPHIGRKQTTFRLRFPKQSLASFP